MESSLKIYYELIDPKTSLEHLIKLFPKEWQDVQDAMKNVIKLERPECINEFLIQNAADIDRWKKRLQSSKTPKLLLPMAVPEMAKARLSLLALQGFLRHSMMQKKGRPPSSLDQWIAQRLFFDRKRRRRSPSLKTFRWIWLLIRAKSAILSTIQSLGIYCVFSQEFGKSLKKIIGKRKTLEIGAGDGTLSLLLDHHGISTIAIDDQSWGSHIRYPEWIEKISGQEGLARYQPQVVICSWPPPNNDFEAKIFATSSVELYLAIVSKHEFAAGNWNTYRNQTDFLWKEETDLAQFLLPDSWGHKVLVFERKQK